MYERCNIHSNHAGCGHRLRQFQQRPATGSQTGDSGVAAMCIEDKLFPKTNSFINSEQQPLADMDEFSGKIRAVKDAQTDDDFCVVARVEAFIAGWDVDEAATGGIVLSRRCGCGAYSQQKNSPDQILEFMKHWQNTCPVVIVPTMYYDTPTDVFEKAGISLVIWANHLLHSSISAMQTTAAEIYKTQSLGNVEPNVVPVKEIFRLQNADELKQAEKRYLPVK
ncbi:MAG: isocitrate lyase/phosphoenolpyruvate mutase family protein [Calditrichia bacterium]